MTYDALPSRYRDMIPAETGQSLFLKTLNASLAGGKTEDVAFASAWAALEKAEFERADDGTWVEKSSATALRNKVEEFNEKYGERHGKVTLGMLRRVYDRGVGAYRTNPSSVRPNVSSPEQWAMARVNSFLSAARGAKTINHDQDVHDDMEKTQPGSVHTPGTDWETQKASGAEPVYAYRPVMNAEMIREWAATQGFTNALPADDMHVTVVFSKAPFCAETTQIANAQAILRYSTIVVRGGKRTVTPLGSKGAVVLKIESADLQYEHLQFRNRGASWDFQEYTPHITITYSGSDAPVAQMQPFMGDIVLGPLRAKPLSPDWDGEVVETALTKAEKATYKPPAGAKGNAERALRWREEHGSAVRGGTSVGWARARQLASGKPISRETVARMSAFNRHRSNSKVDPKFKDEPWRDAGHVAWLLWGGTTGVDWARRIMGSIAKRMLNDDTFTMREEAMARSYDLGLDGAIHVHETADGMATFMPGESHEAYLEHMSERAGLYEMEDTDEGYDEDDSEEESGESESDGLLERVISAILQAVIKDGDMDGTFVKTADIIKVDGERRIAWGWASVSTMKGELVVDRQGDIITPVEMEKMADSFMASARTAKAMHEGEGVGEVLHSLPLTKDIAAALGLNSDREGWVIGLKIHDDDVWEQMKTGTFSAFSIGGRARAE